MRMLKQPSQVFNSSTRPVLIRALNALVSGFTISLLQ